ncbi:MAG: hypothetical protein BAJALOKI3v1_10006 [Promethearchaeota archaeon]|nr:MAG: hypothetical protein BAJALOKI3v1_10006 [Candidatus Lokiarchaeota archaeon]
MFFILLISILYNKFDMGKQLYNLLYFKSSNMNSLEFFLISFYMKIKNKVVII